MKLSPDASRSANVLVWNPANLDDQPARLRYQPSGSNASSPIPSGKLAESLFAPALADDLTENEIAPVGTDAEEYGGQPPASINPARSWLSGGYDQSRMMEDCSHNWIPAEFSFEPVGVDSQTAGPNVESIREAALSVARAAILETMRQEASQILTQARNQAAEIMQQARSEAGEEMRRAQQEGLSEARTQAESMLQMLTAMVNEAQNWQTNLMRRSERQAVSLVKDIAARLFGDGFVLDPAMLSLAFERALAEAKSLGDVRIRAHPEDLAILGELWPAHQMAMRGQRIEMIPDLDIQRGGCFIDGQFGSVDGRIDSQMRLIHERLDHELVESERPENAFQPMNIEDLTR